MSDAVTPAADRDLVSIAEARALARRAKAAWLTLAEFDQAQIDAIVGAMAAAATPQAEAFARLAVEETGYGVVEDKIQKNLFASQRVYQFIRDMKTVGVVARHEDRRVVEIAEPFGVVAAVVPSTNPTSTAIYKILISLKARCSVVLSPHPAAVKCITRVAEVMEEAARRAGAPQGSINWMSTVTIEGTQELMKHRDVAVILATGGMGLVRAAYSAGKPAYGVGPGNAPAYIERTADVRKAVRDVVTGKTFDNGVLCSSENSVVVDEPIVDAVRQEFLAQGGYFLSKAEMDALARVLVTPQRLPNPALVGKSAVIVAEKCGLSVPSSTRVLIAPLEGVGRDYPLSIEKLCPVLSFYVVRDWREGCERCKEILRYGGMGHTMSIHSQNDQVVLEFGLKKPAFRIIVNSPTTHGSIGLTTGLDPAMTLGCGGYGGNITSDNISPRHLLNIKRLAYETTPAVRSGLAASAVRQPSFPRGIPAKVLTDRIDQFLGSRGYRVGSSAPVEGLERVPHQPVGFPDRHIPAPSAPTPPLPEVGKAVTGIESATTPAIGATAAAPIEVMTFVCEADVRQAIHAGRLLVVSERAIVTPSARELGEQHKVFRFQ